MGKVRARASSRDRAKRRGARQAHLEGPDVLEVDLGSSQIREAR